MQRTLTNDRRDALVLAQLGASDSPFLHEVHHPSETAQRRLSVTARRG